MTSSPGLILRSPNLGEVRAENAKRFAEEPELVKSAYLTPIYSANFFSKSLLKRPAVSQKSKEESTRFLISFSS
ncbi:hypothetical protein D3C73_957870 [compost metagenome]